MIPTLKPFQRFACERVVAARQQGAKVIVLCSPTGSGKTTMGCDLVRRALAKGSRVLEIVHRRRLVEQFYGRLQQFEIPYGVLMRGDRRYRPGAPVQVASRDTLLSRVQPGDLAPPPADLVIVDEGRHAASPEFRKLLAPYEAAGATIVLLDATPVTADGTGLGPWAKALVVAAKVSDLVKSGDLVGVKCYAPDRDLYHGKVRRRGIAGDLVGSWQQYAEGLPTVLFCSRVQHSLDAVAAFRREGIRAVHLDADTKDADRDAAYDGLEDGRVQIVSNVGIIKEGVDVPALGCCQFHMDPKGRVGFLQGCGRIMRPYKGKTHGILIDHAGAVFRHGFPDEDTEWTLDGNVNENFAAHRDDLSPKPLYCKHCKRLYHGQASCPECGRLPAKPPRSVFAPDEVDATSEILTEADRGGERPVPGREEKIQHWFRCLMTAKKQGGTFAQASAIYRKKYNEWPGEDFPLTPDAADRRRKVADVYPDFGKKKTET